MSEALITLIILGVTVVVFIWDRLPVMLVALAVPVALWATGVLDLAEAFKGFGDPTVIFIAALFVVSEALDATGVTAWVGDLALRLAGESRTRLLVVILLLVAVVTAVITPNGSVAALTPVVVVMAIRAQRAPSELLMPLAFGAHAGSMLLLTGSPVNLVIADYAESAGVGPFGLFSFTFVGVPLVLGTLIIVVLLGPRLIPRRTAGKSLRDLGGQAAVLTAHYEMESDRPVRLTREMGVLEAVIPPRSEFIGDIAYPGMRTESGRLVVVAVRHRGHDHQKPHGLHAGDVVLFQGAWPDLEEAAQDPNILAVDSPEQVRRQAVPLGAGAKRTLVVLAVMIILLATGLIPAPVAGLLAGLFVVTTTLGQLISNMATAFIVVPVGLAAAIQMDVSPAPILMAIAVFAAAALLTPVATPANLVVMEAAGYRFGDYWKLGLPLLGLYGLVGIGLVPLFMPF